MGNREISNDFTKKIDQIKINLKSWTLPEWVLFFMVIPLVLLLIYAIPQEMKNSYFILNTANPGNLQTWFLNGYTHSRLYHIESNVIAYFLALIAVFSLENNKRRFWIMAGSSFFLVPLIASFLTVGLNHFLGFGIQAQGFSATVAAFVAYTFISIVLWILGDRLENFDHPEWFRSRLLFYLQCGLLIVMLSVIIVGGLILGLFINTGESTSNGIAHFGGFITILIVFLIYDALTEQRIYFDLTLGVAIGMGILWYGNYLVTLIHMVKGG